MLQATGTYGVRALREALAERILVIGGPYGTYVHGRDLSAEDYGGAQYEGCPEQLVITRPDVIEDAHRGYLEAGADIISTNTFGGGSIVLAEYGLQDRVQEINEAAARLSRKVADTYSTPERWRVMEGLLIKLALSPVTAMSRWGRIIPFTTLALSPHDESLLVALPADKAERIDRKTPSIKI